MRPKCDSSQGQNARDIFPRTPSSEHFRHAEDRRAPIQGAAHGLGEITNQNSIQPNEMDNSTSIVLADQRGQTFRISTKNELSEVKVSALPNSGSKFRTWLMDLANPVRTHQQSDQGTYNWVINSAKPGQTIAELGQAPPKYATLEMKLSVALKKVLPSTHSVKVEIDHLDRKAMKDNGETVKAPQIIRLIANPISLLLN